MTLRPCLTCGTLTRASRCPAHKSRRNGSTRQWRATRAQILTRDNHACKRCGQPAQHVDHRVPVTRGGTDHPSNLQALCADCNHKKGAR